MVHLDPRLADLGWDQSWTVDYLARDPEARRRPARVTLQGRDVWRVNDGADECTVGVRGRLRTEAGVRPVAGDWVLLGGTTPDDAVIEDVLDRRTALVRKAAGARTDEQVVAANVDVVVICTPVQSLNLRRLERELTLVWESGAVPVVAITKADLDHDVEASLAKVRAVALGVEVIEVSAYDGDGLEDVRALIPRGVTAALIGPSGAGKSTLVNALVGHELLATYAVRADLRGVHTTSARHLVPVPGAGLLLDTPGMRELALWADEDALDTAWRSSRPAAGSTTVSTPPSPGARCARASTRGSSTTPGSPAGASCSASSPTSPASRTCVSPRTSAAAGPV
jgi:ribosome biogenesis GTPase